MVTVGKGTRHKQILARHAHGAAAAQIEQRRFQSTEAFVQREDAFDFFVGKNESHDFKQFASMAAPWLVAATWRRAGSIMSIAYPDSAYSEQLGTALQEAVPYINKTDMPTRAIAAKALRRSTPSTPPVFVVRNGHVES